MTVTVQGNDLDDVRQKIRLSVRTPHISIDCRDSDYGRSPELGYVVTEDRGRRIPLEFKDARSALTHLQKTLKAHETLVKEKIAKYRKDMATASKNTKKK